MQAKCQGRAEYALYTDGSKTKDGVGAGAGAGFFPKKHAYNQNL